MNEKRLKEIRALTEEPRAKGRAYADYVGKTKREKDVIMRRIKRRANSPLYK